MVKRLSAPVLYSLDAVVDGEGKVWWLEMNSNPVMPPPGYPAMLQDLFGVAIPDVFQSHASAPAARSSAGRTLMSEPVSLVPQP
jgi:hypothetical protein